MKKKALTYTLAVALLLSLAACGKSQADQQTTEPEPPQIQATIPEAETTPEKPEQTPATTEPKTPEVKSADKVADVKPEEQGEELKATAPETAPEEKPQEPQKPVPVQENKPQEPQKPVEQKPVEQKPVETANQGDQQGSQDTYDADIEARRQAFINSLDGYFDERGYLEGADHPLTYEEALDIVGALNGGTRPIEYQGVQQQEEQQQPEEPTGDVNDLLDIIHNFDPSEN